MRGKADRHLVVLAIVLSVALTALTISAVARQGQTLRDRELADLRESATRVAAERSAALEADLQRAFEAAGQAWSQAGADGLDRWLNAQPLYVLAFGELEGQPWTPFPITPLQRPLPQPPTGAWSDGEELEFEEHDLPGALDHYERLAESAAPDARACALLGAAACRRKLGYLQSAAAAFAEAAAALRSDDTLARHAYGAELATVDCLLEARQAEEARTALLNLLETMRAAHPARYGPAEVALLRRRVETLAPDREGDPLWIRFAVIERRAARRQVAPTVGADLFRAYSGRPEPSGRTISFMTASASPYGTLILAVRRVATERRLALAAPPADLVTQYWGPPSSEAPWRVTWPDQTTVQEPLHVLGDAFGRAVLVPTAETLERLGASSHKRLALLLATSVGTAGAWGVVIWMMLRVMGRQRELVRLQSRFVADVSHELKTPLALVRLLGETLRDGRVRDPQRVREYHETITRESERLSVLLDNILDFSRIESGRKHFELADCDIGAVARQAWALFEPQFAADGFTAKLALQPDLPTVRADGHALGQVLVNLLQNACRYGAEGKFVRLSVTRQGLVIVISVEDHGIGMSRSQLRHLGESFYRAADPRVRRARGTGLGLTIVSHIVAAHNGKLDVQSRPGQGSTFTIWLPIESQGENEAGREAKRADESSRRSKS